MKKRILSLLCVLCLMLTMLPTSAFAAGYDAPTLSIEASYDSASSKVTAKVILGACSDLGVLDFHMKYDLDKLAVESIVGNEEFGSEDYTTISDNTATTKDIGLSFVKSSGMTVTGTKLVFTATFSVKPGQTGDAQFSFDDYYTNFAHKNGEDTASTPAAGSVTTTTVTIPKAPISSVTIADLNAPVKGAAPDTSVTVTPSSLAADVKWFDGATPVTGNFAANTPYTVKIKLTASGGDNFAETVTAGDYTVTRNSETELLLTKTFGATAIKDTPVCVAPTGVTATFGSALSTITLTNPAGNTAGKWYWMDNAQKVGNVKDNPHTYKAKFVPNDTANFSTVENIDVTVTATQVVLGAGYPIMIPIEVYYTGSAIEPTPTIKTDNYGDELVLNQDYKIKKYEDNTNVGTGKIYIEPLANGNYSFTAGSYTFTIKAGTSSISITGDPSKTYDGNVVTDPAVSKSGSTGAVTYIYYTDAACTTKTTTASGAVSDGAAPKNAGDYWVKATLAADSNHDSATSAAKKFTISQKALTNDMIILGTQTTYDGTAHGPVYSVKDGATVLNKGTDYTETSGYSPVTNVGNTTLKISGAGNYKGTAQKDWSLVAKEVTITPDAKSKTYGTADPELTYTTSIDGEVALKNKFVAAKSGALSYTGMNVGSYPIGLGTLEAGNNFKLTLDTTPVYLTITPKNVADAEVTATISDQTTIKGVGEFVDPVIKGVKGEDLTGTLTYGYDSETGKSHAEVVTMLKGKNVNDVVTLTYTFTPPAGNYTGTKTGSFKVTVKDIEFLVNGTPATVANTLTVKANPTYGDDWSDIVKKQTGVTITAKVGTATDTDQSHFTLRPTGKPSAGNGQTYELVYKGTINGTNYDNVVVVSGTVDVARKDVTAAMIAGIPAQTYTGSAIQPKPAVTDGAALVEGTDFTYSYDANTNVAAGGKVTITGQGNYKGTADKTFTISPKNISGATINLTSASLPYSGLEQTVSIASVTLTGWTITAGDYDIVGNSDKATNVGSTTLTIQGKGNYTGTATATWKITAIDPVLANFDVTPTLPAAQAYDGAHKTVTVVPKSGVNGMGTVKVYYEATTGITYPKSETAPTDVGTYKVTASVAAGSNYNAKDIDVGTLTINQATGGTLAAYNFQQKYTDLTAKTITPDYSNLPAGQTWTYSVSAPVTSGTAAVTGTSIGADTGVLSYTLTAGAKDNTVKWTVTISSHNYADFTKEVTLTLTDKDDQAALTLTGGTTVVYGQTLQLGTSGGSGTGTVTYAVTNGTGEATIDATGLLTPVKVGTVKVTATKAGDASYNSITSAEVEIHITRATPTGAPKYTAITTSGKTLADAGLTTTGSTLNPNAGTLVWVDNADNVLPGTTAVAANTTYKWLFTPTDTNYTTLTGSIELYHKSSSGGGGWYYTYYTIKATAGTNGSISPSGWTSVRDGRDQTFTITPDKGYAVAKVLVDGKSVGAVKSYTFKNVTKDHTIEAIFMKSNGNPQTGVFVDVAEGSYYEEAIDWAVEKGITNGVSSNMFAPNDPCTRAQIVTFLWRAAGSPAPKSMSSFTDVPADAFYAKAVAWAVENGITSGTGESKFSPNATCTRAQAVTFLYRASGSPAVSGSAEFSDVATNAYYADAVAWAAKKGITTGIGGGLFGSDNDCTRGQIVTFLWRAMAE